MAPLPVRLRRPWTYRPRCIVSKNVSSYEPDEYRGFSSVILEAALQTSGLPTAPLPLPASPERGSLSSRQDPRCNILFTFLLKNFLIDSLSP
jgi:hypothetical protein